MFCSQWLQSTYTCKIYIAVFVKWEQEPDVADNAGLLYGISVNDLLWDIWFPTSECVSRFTAMLVLTLKFSFGVFDVTPTSFSFLVQALLSLWLKAAVLTWQDVPTLSPFLHIFLHCWPVVWKAVSVLLLTLVAFTQAPICMLLIYKSHFFLFWCLSILCIVAV